MQHIAIKESPFKIAGTVTINTYRAGMVDMVMPLLKELQLTRARGPRENSHQIVALKSAIDQVREAYFLRTAAEVSNLVVDSPNYGLDLIIQRLVGINTYSLNILWIELGTGSTAPTVNDTGLTTPSIRIPVSFQEDYGATEAILQAYVTDANLANGTYNEVGSFVDGSSSIGSGQLFNHALISPAYTKVAGQDTTVEIDFTIVNS